MNARQRHLATLTFKQPDRIPFDPGSGRESTLQRWHSEGLPEGHDPVTYAMEQLHIPIEPTRTPVVDLGVDFRLRPQFEEKIIEHKGGHYIVQDWKGNICEISDEFEPHYLRNPIDFVTRRWIKCPVETREDWEMMKSKYILDAPGRFPDDFDEQCLRIQERDWPLIVSFPGPFWQLREWCGFEALCMLMLDDPGFVEEMIAFWQDFVTRMLERILASIVPDSVRFDEDMAYKAKSMISMDMARTFCMPSWKAWSRQIKEAGCPVVAIDSDGFIGELIPLWIEAGVNACEPIEVAAHCDLVDFRKRFGRSMAYRGGVDKRCMAAGGRTLEEEMRRIEPIAQDGGYIPSCDHGIPHDVSWKNYMDYCHQLAVITGWL